jgi:beta-galactosidase
VALQVERATGQLTLAAAPWKLGFDPKTGFLNSLLAEGKEWIERGPRLQIWRAATDNDGIKLWTGQGTKALGRWREAGLDRLELRLKKIELVRQRGDSIAHAVRTVHSASGRGKWTDFEHEQVFEILADGSLRVANVLRLGATGLTDLPRFGVTWALPPGQEKVRWFGRGPWESYSDRKTSTDVGLYENTVAGLYVPYVMPQEHGNHTDTRWVELASAQEGSNGPALRFTGEPLLNFSASHFTADDLYRATHTIDLVPRAETILSLDGAQRGLGTGSCGPDTLPAYRLAGRKHAFAYRVSLVSPT